MIDSEFDFDEIGFEVADQAVFASKGVYLSDLQKRVLKAAWEGQTYEQMASSFGYSDKYLKRDVGPKLWKLLSDSLGEGVSKNNFRMALQRYLEKTQVQPSCESSQPESDQHWGKTIDVSIFYGRLEELSTLGSWVLKDRCRLLTLLGMGGVGKTALAAKLVDQVSASFEFIIWKSLRNAPSISDFLSELMESLSPAAETPLPGAIETRVIQLVHVLRQHRCLLVLDNVETVLREKDCSGQYCEGYEGYGLLLRYVAEMPHQSCVILTTREQPIGLASKEGACLPIRSFQVRGLKAAAGQMLLQAKGVVGSEEACRQLLKRYGGNPLAVKIAATTVQTVFDGQVTEFLDQGNVIFSGIRDLLDQQFNRLCDLEKKVMYGLAVEQEPMSLHLLQEALGPEVRLSELSEALESLLRRCLIQRRGGHFTQQRMVMEYMIERMRLFFLRHRPQNQLPNLAPQPVLYAS